MTCVIGSMPRTILLCAIPLYLSIFLFHGFVQVRTPTLYHNPATAISSTRQLGPQLILQRGHSSVVGAFAFSPDGEVLATGGEDWTVKAWRVKTGELIYSLGIDGSWDFKLAISPDSKTLAIFIRFGKAQIRDARTGALLRTLDSGAEPGAIAFSPDNTTLACGTVDGSISLWNYQTGRRLRAMKAHVGAGGVGVLAFSHDGQYVASSEGEHNFGKPSVELWSVATGALINTIRPQGEIDSITFSPDGKTLALGVGSWIGEKPAVELWDFKKNVLLQRLLGHKFNIVRIAFSRDGGRIASGDSQGIFKQWDPATGKALRSFGHEKPWEMVEVSPDARLAALPERDGSVRILDVESGNELSRSSPDQHAAHKLAFLADNQTLAVATGSYTSEPPDGEVHFWDLRTGAWKGALTGMDSTYGGLAVSGNGSLVVTGGQDGITYLWDRKTFAYLGQAGVPKSRILSVALSPDGGILAIAGDKKKPEGTQQGLRKPGNDSDPVLDLWDTSTRKRIRTLKGHSGLVTSVAFSADGNSLYSQGYDPRLIIWDLKTGATRRTIGSRGSNESLAIDRAESVIAVGGDPQDIKTFDLHTGKLIRSYDTGDQARQVAISPDGQKVAAGDTKGNVWLWATRSGALLRRLQGVNEPRNIRFSPDGTLIAAIDGEETVKLWDVATGKLRVRLAVLGGLGAESAWIAYTPDGYYEGSPGIERYIRWNVNGQVFPAERFRNEFHNPARVQAALTGSPQASLFAQQASSEAQLRELIRKQKVVVQLSPDDGSQRKDPGAKYLGIDATLYESLSTGMYVGDKPLTDRIHKEIKDQVAGGAGPNVQGRWGTTPLMYMAWYGDQAAVEDLLNRGANVNAVDVYGSTPLLHAVEAGNYAIARRLLEKGADLKDEKGKSFLKLVGNPQTLGSAAVTALYHTADFGGDKAIVQNYASIETAHALVWLGADPNSKDEWGRTLLTIVTGLGLDGEHRFLQLLFDNGVNVNAADKDGYTPLSMAARQGKADVARLLISHGAKANKIGDQSLMNAAYGGHLEVVRLLLDHGADPNVNYGKGDNRTALMMAVGEGHTEIVKLLIQRGAKVNAISDYDNWNALTFAATRGDAELVKLLLSKGADVNIRNKKGLTLIKLVKEYPEQANDRFGIIALLKKAGARE